MSKIYPKKSNGDEGRDCEVEKTCQEPAYQLSASREPIGLMSNRGIQKYRRTIRYKCLNGHRFDKEDVVAKDLLSPTTKSTNKTGVVNENN